MAGVAWFAKSRRAQSVNDFETWLEGGAAPTLNLFDIGDARTAMIIVYSIREDAAANNFSATEIETALTIQAHQPSAQSHHAQAFIVQTGNEMNDETPAVVRRLTPLECERLQGFPDNWTAGQLDTHRYKQMGNAVTVNVAAAVGSFIVLAERENNKDSK